jgi:hypothetical protein
MASKIAEKLVSARMAAIDAVLQPMVKAQESAALNEARAGVYEKLAGDEFGKHADAREIIESQKYVDAIAKAPEAVQKCAQSWDPAIQRFALEWYKAHAGIKSAVMDDAAKAHAKATAPARGGLRNAGVPKTKAPDGDDENLSEEEKQRLFDAEYDRARVPA